MKKTYQVLNSIKYNFEDGEMVSYKSYFADGKSETIKLADLPEEVREAVKEMYKIEYNCHQREQRRTRKAKGLKTTTSHDESTEQKHFLRSKRIYDTSNPVLAEVIRKESRERIRQAISKLQPEQQELIQLKYFEEMKQCDIAKHYGTSTSNISHKINRTEKRLKKLVS